MLVHENYTNEDSLTIEDVQTITECLSYGDLNMKEPYYSWSSVIKPTSIMRKTDKQLRFPSLLGKMSSIKSIYIIHV